MALLLAYKVVPFKYHSTQPSRKILRYVTHCNISHAATFSAHQRGNQTTARTILHPEPGAIAATLSATGNNGRTYGSLRGHVGAGRHRLHWY